MNVQIVTLQKVAIQNIKTLSFTVSSFASPYSFDDFDINVVDLSCKELWRHNSANIDDVNLANDLVSCRNLMANSKSSKILVVYPQNIDFRFGMETNYSGVKEYSKSVKLKDMLPTMVEMIIPRVLNSSESNVGLTFEKTKTTINTKVFESDFCFNSKQYTALTFSDVSKKATSVKRTSQDKYFHTSLNVLDSLEDLVSFLSEIGLIVNEPDLPDWLIDFNFLDDESQREQIIECNKEIAKQNELRDKAEQKIQENTEYKCALVYGDQDLVGIVFRILSQILEYDFSDFVDKKIEDFRIELNGITFIGEIKGVNTNVKSEHVSQVDRHYHMYLDELEESGEKKNVKQILIVNSMRNLPLLERKPIGQTQIDLANRNNCLIILTSTLLKMYECFQYGRITSARCRELFETSSGELKIEQFSTYLSEQID